MKLNINEETVEEVQQRQQIIEETAARIIEENLEVLLKLSE